MKTVTSRALALLAILSFPATAEDLSAYFKVGTGYKLQETDHITRTNDEVIYFATGGKFSARIELGAEKGPWSFGLSHHSQWGTGWPVNDGDEYQKTEIFVDYKFTLF